MESSYITLQIDRAEIAIHLPVAIAICPSLVCANTRTTLRRSSDHIIRRCPLCARQQIAIDSLQSVVFPRSSHHLAQLGRSGRGRETRVVHGLGWPTGWVGSTVKIWKDYTNTFQARLDKIWFIACTKQLNWILRPILTDAVTTKL